MKQLVDAGGQCIHLMGTHPLFYSRHMMAVLHVCIDQDYSIPTKPTDDKLDIKTSHINNLNINNLLLLNFYTFTYSRLKAHH